MEAERVAHYLDLGAVVVIAPHRRALPSWPGLDVAPEPVLAPASAVPRPSGVPSDGLRVDRRGRRVWHRDVPLRLAGLEYEVLAHLVESPGKAWSFHELRCAAWGPGPDYGGDSFAVRSLVQRLRRKLALAGVSSRIEAVRGYGFRFEP